LTEVNIPEAHTVNKYLQENEQIIDWIYSIGGPGGPESYFYATNKRLIKRKNSLIGQVFGFTSLRARFFGVEFTRIVSITFHSYHPKTSFVTGVILGLFSLFWSIFFFLLPPPHPAYSGPDPRMPMGLFFLLLGAFFAVVFCRIKLSYHQINIRNASKKDVKEWRIPQPRKGKGKEKIERFIDIVQDKINDQAHAQNPAV
jgi:hypothetical protein